MGISVFFKEVPKGFSHDEFRLNQYIIISNKILSKVIGSEWSAEPRLVKLGIKDTFPLSIRLQTS